MCICKYRSDVENCIQVSFISSHLLDAFRCVSFVRAKISSLELYFISV